MSQSTHQSGSLVSYTVGFVLSVAITLAAYVATVNKIFTGWSLVILLVFLAVTQLLVQLICFLHIGREAKPRWNLMAFLFMALMFGVIAIGSLWIMHNMNYRMVPKGVEVNNYLSNQDGL